MGIKDRIFSSFFKWGVAKLPFSLPNDIRAFVVGLIDDLAMKNDSLSERTKNSLRKVLVKYLKGELNNDELDVEQLLKKLGSV